jgi:hypothetical protein
MWRRRLWTLCKAFWDGGEKVEQALHFERELADIKAKQAAADEQHKTIFRRLDLNEKMLETVRELAQTVSIQTQAIKTIQEDLSSMSDDIDTLKSEPANKWKLLSAEVLKLLVAAIAGFVLSRIGL